MLFIEQLKLEHEAHVFGVNKYKQRTLKLLSKGNLLYSRSAKPLLLDTLFPKLLDHFIKWRTKCASNKSRLISYFYLKDINPKVAAYITIKVAFAILSKKTHTVVKLQGLVKAIGDAISDEIQFSSLTGITQRFIQDHIKALDGYRYKKNYALAIQKYRLKQPEFTKWPYSSLVHVGVKMLGLLIESTSLPVIRQVHKRTASYTVVELNPIYKNIINKNINYLSNLSPLYEPCIISPKPWTTSAIGGGYWSQARAPLPLIKSNCVRYVRNDKSKSTSSSSSYILDSINLAQSTAWKVNIPVLNVVKEIVTWKNCPISDSILISIGTSLQDDLPIKPKDISTNLIARKEWRRAANHVHQKASYKVTKQLRTEFLINQAIKFSKYDSIWFPYTYDWRGRMYSSSSSLNPQGNDINKGLLTFAQGKPIGHQGFYWLKIHGANCAGHRKKSFTARLDFIHHNHDNILASAANPLNYLWWTTAAPKHPFSFLAFCIEYANVVKSSLDYPCSLPIMFDANCSGLQHLALLTRDSTLAKLVNLSESESESSSEPQDVYQLVASRTLEQLYETSKNGTLDSLCTQVTDMGISETPVLGTKHIAQLLLCDSSVVTREVAKIAVIATLYGSTRFSLTNQLVNHLGWYARYQLVVYLSTLLQNVINDILGPAVLELIAWFKKVVTILKDKSVSWTTSDGFPVSHSYSTYKRIRVSTILLGSMYIKPTFLTDDPVGTNLKRQRLGIVPNFIHSQDANHLRLTIRHAHERYQINSFALIHDSYGTNPADSDNLLKSIRESLVSMYTTSDPILAFYNSNLGLPDIPTLTRQQELNIKDILLHSQYAFN